MKKITLFLSVLFMAMVVKAQVTETYEFYNWATSAAHDFTNVYTDKTVTNANGATLKVLNYVNYGDVTYQLNGRFAVTDNVVWVRYKNGGPQNTGLYFNGAKNFSILNLIPGDKLTFTIYAGSKTAGSPDFVSANVYLESDETKTLITAGTEIKTGEVYVVAGEEGSTVQVDFTGVQYDCIHTLKIETTASETISAPSCSLTGANNGERTVTIVPGVGSVGSVASSTYYTLDGTDPSNTNGTEYTEPFVIAETTTVKAISYLASGTASEITTFEAEAGTTISLNSNIVDITGLVGEGDVKNAVVTDVYVSAGVIGAPNATITCTFNGEPVTLPYTVTEDGTLVATASAEGYASATETLELKAGYTIVKSVDFTATTDENITELLGDAWSVTETNVRWAFWATIDGGYSVATCGTPANLTDFLGTTYGGQMLVGYGVGRNTNNGSTEYWINNPEEGQIAFYEVNEAKKATTDFVEYVVAYADNNKMSHTISSTNVIAKVSVYSPVRELVVEDGENLDATGTYTSATFEREFNTAYTYGTICLPFAPDAETCAKYNFYKLASDNQSTETLVFEEETEPKANVAYLYSPVDKAEAIHTFTGGATTISTVSPVVGGDWQFVGTFEKLTEFDYISAYYFAYLPNMNDGKDMLSRVSSGLQVNPYRAYFIYAPQVATGSIAPLATMRIVVRGAGDNGDGTTGIEEVITPDQIEGAAPAIYNLMGQPVAQPVKGQIYIVNGQKVVY